jgi:hypothetical protein
MHTVQHVRQKSFGLLQFGDSLGDPFSLIGDNVDARRAVGLVHRSDVCERQTRPLAQPDQPRSGE